MKNLFIVFAILVIFSSCTHGIKSLSMVGESHQKVSGIIEHRAMYHDEVITRSYVTTDTIVFGDYFSDGPTESMFLFDNKKCYYQHTKIYCSACADKNLERVLKDKRYRFKEIDGTNYQSEKNENIILRVKFIEGDGCSEIRIIDTSVQK